MGSNAEIYGSRNPLSVRTGAQLRTLGKSFVNISDVEPCAQVRVTMIAFFLDPHHSSGCSLTAETVTTDNDLEILSECAAGAGLANFATITSVKQYFLHLSRANDTLGAHFTKGRRHPMDHRPYQAALILVRLLSHLQ